MAEICRRNTGLVSHLVASKAAMGFLDLFSLSLESLTPISNSPTAGTLSRRKAQADLVHLWQMYRMLRQLLRGPSLKDKVVHGELGT